MTLKNTKRINQPKLSTNRKLSSEFMYVLDNKTGAINDNRNIHDLSCGSGLMAKWKCNNTLLGINIYCNHEWFSVIKDRGMKNQGCPSCSGNTVTEHNCLATVSPKLASEWDIDKNTKTIWEVTKSSAYVADWVCNECSYNWSVRVNDRFNNRGCPRCAKKVTSSDYNLLILHPGLVLQLHSDSEIIPEETLPCSHKKAHWLCNTCNKDWYASIYSRTIQGSNCPNCQSNKSYHEMRVLSELRVIFGNKYVLSGNRFGRLEADIFIKKYNLIIEYDGTYFHQDIKKDKKIKR